MQEKEKGLSSRKAKRACRSCGEQHTPEEGVSLTSSPAFAAFKVSTTQAQGPAIDVPALVTAGQGRKSCYVGDRVFECSPGKALIMFYPLNIERKDRAIVECEVCAIPSVALWPKE